MPRTQTSCSGVRLLLAACGILQACLASADLHARASGATADVPKKLAVLPLQPVSPDAATGDLGVALSQEIARRLMSAETLIVRPPGVVRRYRAAEPDVPAVARDVDVEFILTGRYRQADDGFEATVTLTEAAGARTVWEGRVADGRDGLRTAAGAAARRVVDALGITLTDERRARLNAPVPRDGKAYEVYLQAIAGDPRTTDEWDARSALLERVVALDPRFAPALAHLGDAYLGHAGIVGGGPYYEFAEQALRRAFALDPECPLTLELLASLAAKVGKAEESAELLHRGLERYPSSPAFHAGLGYIYRYAGLMDESIAFYRKAQALDASLADLVSTEGQITKSLIYQGAYEDALASQLAVNGHLEALGRPRDEKQLFYEGMIHYYAGRLTEASALFDASWAVDDRSIWSTFGQAYKWAGEGDVARARALAEELETRDVVDGERRIRLAHFYALIGDTAAALRHLSAAIANGFFNVPYLAGDRLLERLRDHAEFGRQLERARTRHAAFARRFGGRLGTN